MEIVIRENRETHMKELRAWLEDTKDVRLEEMGGFFSARLESYEDHMAVWQPAYERFAQLLAMERGRILDLGCGTGLELDWILRQCPNVSVTGVDLCQDMLDQLKKKHGDRVSLICEDYFQFDMQEEIWDAVISFESLHHFFPEEKKTLYQKIYQGLKKGGRFLLGDYIACCDEEESLLQAVYQKKRERFHIPEGQWVHFDIPLTIEHETECMRQAGFSSVRVLDSIQGATIVEAVRD